MTALEAKALYVTALTRHLMEAAGRCLVNVPLYLPAFVLVTAAAEAHGRCLLGDRSEDRGSTARLRRGLFAAMLPGTSFITPHGSYDIRMCVALRNFTTHGGTTPKPADLLDGDLIGALLQGMASALDRYWVALQQDPQLRKALAEAAISPMATSSWVIFINDMKGHFTNGGTPGSSLLHEQAWRS